MSEDPWIPAFLQGGAGFIISFLVVWLLMPPLIRFLRREGIVGVDEQKLEQPKVPETGGIGILVGMVAGLVVTALLVKLLPPSDIYTNFLLRKLPTTIYLSINKDDIFWRVIELILVVFAAGLVGLLDDFHPLKGRQKPTLTLLLTAVAFSPFVAYYFILRGMYPNNPEKLSVMFTPYIEIPGHPPVSLTILFPFIAMFAVTIGANAVNMMDVYNGVMPATTGVVAGSLLISAYILGRIEAYYLLLPFLGAVGAYYLFNRYPARVFSGDVGSFGIGAGLVAIAFLARLEIVLLIAMIPFILNAMDTLLTVGLRERRDMDARPTLLTSDGKLAVNTDPRAPVPLANLLLLDGPKTEKELIRQFIYIVAFSSVLGILTAVITLLIRLTFLS